MTFATSTLARREMQGECALDAENIVKLFTMDMVDQQKVEEYVYEMALQVMTTTCPAVSAPCGSSRSSQPRPQRGCGRRQWSTLQQRVGRVAAAAAVPATACHPPEKGWRT